MYVDVVIVGAGIQGLILARELKKQGLNISCITNEDIGGTQTLRSQFYLHRGHFYKDINLAHTLNNTYSKWVSLINEMNLKRTVDQSYIGFSSYNEEKLWLDVWEKASLPFEKTKALPEFLKQSKGSSFYKFPHILFSGQTLIDQLSNELHPYFVMGNVAKITKFKEGFQEISINNNSKHTIIRAKHLILCAGSGNNALIKLIDTPHKNVPNMQKRSCQILVLKGELPNLSILIPELKIFIAPQYAGKKVYWLYTFGTDPLVYEEQESYNFSRFSEQVEALFKFFPFLSKSPQLQYSMYYATKIESADLGAGHRPNQACVHPVTQEILAIWPTKLTLAFEAAKEAFHYIKKAVKAENNVRPATGKQKFLMENYNEHVTLNHYL